MNIEIHRPELQRMMQEEIRSGHFRDAEDLLVEALLALREKHSASPPTAPQPRTNLADFLLNSPFAKSDLNLERKQDFGRPVDL